MHRIILCIFLLFSLLSYAQNGETIDEQFKKLRLNSSPAYTILGIEPENIQRPNSPTDFLASIQSAVVNDHLQPNFAIETSPYYWKRKGADNRKFDAVNYVVNRSIGENILRSLTFSFASSATDTVLFANRNAGTGFGFGMHFNIIPGQLSKPVRENLNAWFYASRLQLIYEAVINALEGEENARVDDVEALVDEVLSVGSLKNLPAVEKENLRLLFIQQIGKIELSSEDLSMVRRYRDRASKKATDRIKSVNEYEFPLTREGFILEFGAASASLAENNSVDSLQSAKAAIWLTPSYRFNVNKDPTIIDIIDIMAVLRITWNAKDIDVSNYFDAGAKLQWTRKRFSLSAESVFRYLSKKPDSQKKNHTVRTAFNLSYKINDIITFQATFGSNFDGNSTTYSDPSKIFMVGGFNFGFSNFLQKPKSN